MSRFILALRCFFWVLFRGRLPAEAAALLPPEARPAAPIPDVTVAAVPAEAAAPPRPMPREQPVSAAPPAPAPEPRLPVGPVAQVSAEAPAPPRDKAGLDELRRRGAVQALAILQREGRLVDFLMEEVDSYGDAQIGAAVRDIHRGCRKGLVEHFKIAPVRKEPDEAAVRVEAGYDPSRVRLIGSVTGRPPFHGTLRHHGWAAQSVTLPDLPESHDPLIITPAEVELGG